MIIIVNNIIMLNIIYICIYRLFMNCSLLNGNNIKLIFTYFQIMFQKYYNYKIKLILLSSTNQLKNIFNIFIG